MLELVADRPRVSLLEPSERLAQSLSRGGRAYDDARRDLGDLLESRAEEGRVELRVSGGFRSERVDSRGEMAVPPNGFDEVRGADDDVNVRGGRLRARKKDW